MSRQVPFVTVLLLFLGSARLTAAQQVRLPPAISQSQSMGPPPVARGDQVQRDQAKAANERRQIEIRRETEKMAELAQELKEYLARNNQGVLSVDAIKKAEQIEKLAHSVKSKMKQSF